MCASTVHKQQIKHLHQFVELVQNETVASFPNTKQLKLFAE